MRCPRHSRCRCRASITVAELRAGVALLPTGRRRNNLKEKLEKQVLPLFVQRVLPFDLGCSQHYADIQAKTRKQGYAIGAADGFIAAIAAAAGFAVATRDTTPFEGAGVAVINPWKGSKE